jgi:hypothetical protein
MRTSGLFLFAFMTMYVMPITSAKAASLIRIRPGVFILYYSFSTYR